jgi:hypothetical protein
MLQLVRGMVSGVGCVPLLAQCLERRIWLALSQATRQSAGKQLTQAVHWQAPFVTLQMMLHYHHSVVLATWQVGNWLLVSVAEGDPDMSKHALGSGQGVDAGAYGVDVSVDWLCTVQLRCWKLSCLLVHNVLFETWYIGQWSNTCVNIADTCVNGQFMAEHVHLDWSIEQFSLQPVKSSLWPSNRHESE